MMNRAQPWASSLVLFLILVFQSPQLSSALVITELMYNPSDESLEFIELYNHRAVFEDLGGFAFTNAVEFEFPAGTILEAKSYLVLARDPNALEDAYGMEGAYGPYTGRLSNDGERIELTSANGEIIISFRYNDTLPWPVAADGTGHSLILSRPGADPAQASTWSASTFMHGSPGEPDIIQAEPEDPTLVTLVNVGHAGRYFKGTTEPAPDNNNRATTDWTKIDFDDNPAGTAWINGASGYGYSNNSAELQSVRTVLNDMRGNYLSVYARLPFTLTSEQISSFTQLRAEVNYDDGFVLYLNGTRVAESGQLPGNPPPFDQNVNSASDYAPASIDLTGRMNLLAPGNNVLAIQAHNASIGGSSDCLGSPVLHAVIEAPMSSDDPQARIVINELLANSAADTGADWLELYNPGPTPVDLSQVYLSDDPTDLLKYRIPGQLELQPGDFWQVSQGPLPEDLPFGLASSGEALYVTAATNDTDPLPLRVMDAVRFENLPPGRSWGRFPDGYHEFGQLSTATLGSANAPFLSHDIVVNEIMYHHGTRDERYEYIELYNRGASAVALDHWRFTDGIEYAFAPGAEIGPDAFLVVAKDPNLLETVYEHLSPGENLVGPYTGNLDDHSERIRLAYPLEEIDPNTGDIQRRMIIADEVTYFDGGRWPTWADGQGASLELRDPHSHNNAPDAWADSDESAKAPWEQFSFTINSSDRDYTHDQVQVFDLMLLNRGEMLLDDLELRIGGSNRLSNAGFESGTSSWRRLGNHVRSLVTSTEARSGSRCLHLIATGHGDPGANRVNQSISSVTASTVTFRGWARWLRGTRHLLLRTTRDRSPVQPPRPSHAFELHMPLNLGTPGLPNTAWTQNRGPDITDVQHAPILPGGGEPITISARIHDNDQVNLVVLMYRSEGSSQFTSAPMLDNGIGNDLVAGDRTYTATIPGASGGTMRAFYIEAYDGLAMTRFPTQLQPSADVPRRTCLVRVGDSLVTSAFANYRIWLSDDVIDTFRARPNLSNELMDCTFVYNNSEVFYNARIRFRGSPFLRSGSGRDPRSRYAYRIDFNPDQRFGPREEINLDNTEGGNRGPLQERASYWFYRHMGLEYSSQEFVRLVINGNNHGRYEDVQKVDGDYIRGWFPDDPNGYIYKVDDYFEFTSDGTGHRNLDEGLKYDSRHPLLPETYRWGFEKRSHRENDNWQHLFDFAVAMNTPANSPDYETMVESVVDPEHFAAVLAIRHAVGDWDSYGYNRGKNNYFYYAPNADKWYLLPWDIDFTLGSGNGPSTNVFAVNGGQFPEVQRFFNHPKFRTMYLKALGKLVSGPWKTSYGTSDPPTAFDRFLDDAADALVADGQGDGRRNGIKQFVRDRRAYILPQVPVTEFAISTNQGRAFVTTEEAVTLEGTTPPEVKAITINDAPVDAVFSDNDTFSIDLILVEGLNLLALQGLDSAGDPIPTARAFITIVYVLPSEVSSVSPASASNNGPVQLTIQGSGFMTGSVVEVALTSASEEKGIDALYVQSAKSFDRIDEATLLLDDPSGGVGDETEAVHPWINFSNQGPVGEFPANEQSFAAPYNRDGSNYAVRFTGYIVAPSPGPRYFGVNSDDGFSLSINNQLVGEFANARAAATTDVIQNRTAGTMTFNFPAAGTYPLVLDFYENGGQENIEFFQTNATGGNRRLINVDAELTVLRDDIAKITATNVVVVDTQTITCDIDLTGVAPGQWNLVVTPISAQGIRSELENALEIVEP